MMPSVFSTTGQAAALAAAAAAAEGAREDAFIASWVATLGSTPELQQLRDGVIVWKASRSGSITIDDGDMLITSSGVTQTYIVDADRDTGAWEFRIVNTSSGEYCGHTCTPTGDADNLAIDGDLSAAGSHLPGTIRMHPPPLDALAPVPQNAGPVVVETSAESISLALAVAQPTAGSTVIVGVVQRGDWPGFSGLADLSPTAYWTGEDLLSLRPNVDGTGAITAANQIVRRINLSGSAGAYLYDPSGVGLYVRQSASGAYYLEGDRVRRFVLGGAASSLISASAGEVIMAATPRSALGYDTDSWFHDALWSIGDGAAGVTLPNSGEARFYVRQSGGGDIYGEAAAAQGTPNLFTWAHAGGQLYGAVGFDADPPSLASAGDLFDVANPAAILGVYHGSFSQAAADVYGIAFFPAKLTTAQRAAAQWWMYRRMVAVSAIEPPTVRDSAGNAYQIIASKDDGASLLSAIYAASNVTTGSGTLAITVTPAGGIASVIAGQAFEVANLAPSGALDQLAVGANNGTTGTISATTPTTQQASELAVCVAGLTNDDTLANMAAPSGWVEAGTSDNASSEVGFVLAHKVLTGIGAVTANPTWDAGSAAGGAALACVTLRTGEGAPAPTGFITTADMADDVDPSKPNEYLLHGVPTSFDWALHSRAGLSQPPADFTAMLPWFVAFTNASAPPGSHNWAIAILRVAALEYRNGSWVITKDTANPAEMEGSLITNWLPETKVAATTRSSNGYLEIYMPDSGGAAHYWTARYSVNPIGAQYRMTLIKCGLSVWNSGLTDDRASAIAANTAAVMQAGMDYWRSLSAPFSGAGVNNYDGGISRCREIGLLESPSWHCVHTMNPADTALIVAAHAEIAALLGV